MTHGDPLWMRAFLGVHVAAGAASFLLAPVALATAKGGKQHRRWGIVYLVSMGVVAGTALPMALYRPVLFLAGRGIQLLSCVLGLPSAAAEGPGPGRECGSDRLDCRGIYICE